MKNWQTYKVAATKTHHICEGEALYPSRFKSVMKFHAPGLAPVLDESGAYHIDVKGKAAYQKRFDHTFGYYEGFAAVSDSTGWFHVDVFGKPCYEERYAWCGNFQEGKCTVRDREGFYFHIARCGDPIYSKRYRYAGDYRDGIAVVCREDGMSSHIDAFGEPVHGVWFKQLDVFHKGYARAKDHKGWYHVTTKGWEAYTARYEDVEPFYNGQAHVQTFAGDLLIIDEEGNPLHAIHREPSDVIGPLSGELVGFWKSETIRAALETKILDFLPGSVEEIHLKTKLPKDNLRRFLRALWEIDLVNPSLGTWELTEKGECLVPSNAAFMAAASIMWSEVQSEWKGLQALLYRENDGHHPTFKEKVSDPEKLAIYQRALNGYSSQDFSEIVQWPVWEKKQRIVGVGQTASALLSEIIQQHPLAKGVLLTPDLPLYHAFDHTGLEHIYQDPLQEWGIVADSVILPRFLHYYPDHEALQIVENALKALQKGGNIYIFEMVLDESTPDGSLLDLNMLIESGGRLRTKREWESLLVKCSFQAIKPHIHLISRRKE